MANASDQVQALAARIGVRYSQNESCKIGVPFYAFTAEELAQFAAALSQQPAAPSAPVGVEGLLKRMEVKAANLRRAATTNREAGEAIHAILDAGHQYEPDDPAGLADGLISDADDGELLAALLDEARAALAQQRTAPSGAVAWATPDLSRVAHPADATAEYTVPLQPAAVDEGLTDEAIERALEARLGLDHTLRQLIRGDTMPVGYSKVEVVRALLRALAAQQQEVPRG